MRLSADHGATSPGALHRHGLRLRCDDTDGLGLVERLSKVAAVTFAGEAFWGGCRSSRSMGDQQRVRETEATPRWRAPDGRG
jgi:hypothetical protein